MMSSIRIAAAAVVVISMSGCANTGLLNGISIGQSKAEVISKMGDPDLVRASTTTEYLNYTLYTKGEERVCIFGGLLTLGVLAVPCVTGPNYFVRLEGGRVSAFGRIGDFNSTQAERLEIEHKVR